MGGHENSEARRQLKIPSVPEGDECHTEDSQISVATIQIESPWRPGTWDFCTRALSTWCLHHLPYTVYSVWSLLLSD